MEPIYVILNGISLPYKAIDYAIKYAKKNSCGIHALFLKGIHEPPKGYLYPSDLRTIETGATDEECVREDEKIIADNIRLVQKLVENESIAFASTLETNTSIDKVIRLVNKADLIVVDEGFDDLCLLSNRKISLKDIKNRLANVHVVPAKEIV
jgi:hypothetical protein